MPESLTGQVGGGWVPVRYRVVASCPGGRFAHDLALDGAGVVFVALRSHHHVERYAPRQAHSRSPLACRARARGVAVDQKMPTLIIQQPSDLCETSGMRA